MISVKSPRLLKTLCPQVFAQNVEVERIFEKGIVGFVTVVVIVNADKMLEQILTIQDALKEDKIPNWVWILPRPRPDHYRGGFPLWFEEKLLKFFELDYKHSDLKDTLIHLFSGMTSYGFQMNISPEVNPDYLGDAHKLPAHWSNRWKIAVCDPPYNDELSQQLYGTGKIHYNQYISEAVRVVVQGGFICSYHWALTPRPDGTKLVARIFVGTRIWHRPRVCCIFQKKPINRRPKC